MRNAIKSFFFSEGRFRPNRYLITLYSHVVLATFILRLCGIEWIDNGLVAIMAGLVPGLIAIDTWRQNSKEKKNAPSGGMQYPMG